MDISMVEWVKSLSCGTAYAGILRGDLTRRGSVLEQDGLAQMVLWRNESGDAELRRDLKTLATFVFVYCQHKHKDAMKEPVRLNTHDVEKIAGRPIRICLDCGKLLAHAITKRAHCPLDPHTANPTMPSPRTHAGHESCDEGSRTTTASARLAMRAEKVSGEGKPACRNCPQHCYHPHWRKRIKEVMRFSGAKLLLTGRLDYLFHILF